MSATNRGAVRAQNDYYATPSWCVDRLFEDRAFVGPLTRPRDGRAAWDSGIEMARLRVLEPCAGDGAIVRALMRLGVHPVNVYAREIDARHGPALSDLGCAYTFGDSLNASGPATFVPGGLADLVITNPPFKLAQEIARHYVLCDRDGDAPIVGRSTVALLLRLNWLGSTESDDRGDFLRNCAPDVYVLPNRPSFCVSAKCKACGWRGSYMTRESANTAHDIDRGANSVNCGPLTFNTTDACEYAWFVWPAGQRERRSGSVRVLQPTAKAER